jgi:hypothetical protein
MPNFSTGSPRSAFASTVGPQPRGQAGGADRLRRRALRPQSVIHNTTSDTMVNRDGQDTCRRSSQPRLPAGKPAVLRASNAPRVIGGWPGR